MIAILITSAKIPEAVTSAPAPAPFIIKGFSGYLSVKNNTILSLPSKL